MKRAQQMRRDLITVAVVAVLLGAAVLLINSNAAFAQSATEDQYSSATSASASPSAAASASPTSDQYSNASGSTASPTTPATATPTASASPTATAPTPVNNTEDPSFTQAKVGALQSALQTIAQATSSALPADTGASTFGGGSFLGLPHWALQTLGGPGWAVINMAQHGPPDPLVRDDPEYLNNDGRDTNGDGRDHDVPTEGAWD